MKVIPIHFSKIVTIVHDMQRERNEDKKQVKGGAFKLNSHPKDMFDENPYRHDRPLPPIKDPKISKDKPKPFKPSNPAKLVSPFQLKLEAKIA